MKKIICADCNKGIIGTTIFAEGYCYHNDCFDKTVLGMRIDKAYQNWLKEFNKFKYI